MYYYSNNMELSKHFGEVQAICCGKNEERGVMSNFMDQAVCQGDGDI